MGILSRTDNSSVKGDFIYRFSVSLIVAATWMAVACPADATEILVSDRFSQSVLRFDGTTGSYLGQLVAPNSGGLTQPSAMTYGYDGDLFVTSTNQYGQGEVLRYDATTGAFKSVFFQTASTQFLGSITYDPASDSMFVGAVFDIDFTPDPVQNPANTIYRLDSAGATTATMTDGTSSGRSGLTMGPNGNLYSSTFNDGAFSSAGVLEFDGSDNFNSLGYFVTPGTSSFAAGGGLLFDEDDNIDGELYAASLGGQEVIQYTISGGAVTGSSSFGDNVAYPSGLLFADDGDLLITSLGNDSPTDPVYGNTVFPGSIFKYDSTTGANVSGSNVPFITFGSDFLPTSLLLSPDLEINSSNLVPEPSTLLSMGLGLLVLSQRRRKVRR